MDALALQKEAVSTALHFAGIDRKPLAEWTPAEGKRSFLDGLPKAYAREDQMIFHDMGHVPGLEKIKSSITGTATFANVRVRLDVILANRTRLEEQTGSDLIYYNATYQSFVLVQYKAMEPTDDPQERAVFRLPNKQLAEEIGRMDDMLRKFAAAPANTAGTDTDWSRAPSSSSSARGSS